MKHAFRGTIIFSLLLWGSAQADVVWFELDPSPNNIANDCVGYYNQGSSNGFDNCVIFAEDDEDRTDISSIIVKFDRDENDWEMNSNYPAFDLDDLTLDYSGEGVTGSWSYATDATVGIRFWVAKSSTGFIVYYDTDDSTCAGADASTYRCMVDANVMYEGTWTTPGEKELSHISFYDSEIRVPEPGTVALLGLGLLGMGLSRRRLRK